MFKHLFRRPLRLALPDRVVTFGSPGDFEFALASRVEVPAGKVAELMALSPEALRREASNIREVERRFVEVLAKSPEEAGSIGYLMREMDPKLFSQDHEWRAIMVALVKQDRAFDEFKKIALVKYMQYLGSRQDVLRSIFATRSRPDAPEPEGDAGTDAAHRETVIFDVNRVELASPPGEEEEPGSAAREAPGPPRARVVRIARGETVPVRVASGEDVHLILSRHPFRLVAGEHPRLVDDAGTEYRLRAGRNVVGRDPDGDVVIDAAYRDVSRKHLVVEIAEADRVLLTDLSSHGTFLANPA